MSFTGLVLTAGPVVSRTTHRPACSSSRTVVMNVSEGDSIRISWFCSSAVPVIVAQ